MLLYCFSETMKSDLQAKGLKIITEKSINDKKCWIFQNNNKLNFSLYNQKDFMISSRLTF